MELGANFIFYCCYVRHAAPPVLLRILILLALIDAFLSGDTSPAPGPTRWLSSAAL